MDFGALPPEINSARMYAGPGPESLLAAATAWENLAAELRSAAGSYRSVVSGLVVGRWLGPSSLSMASALGPYMAWTAATAARAEEAASQAAFAVDSYDAAFAMTVPPPAVTANRAQLASLIATNLLGQNAAAIAANEAAYAEMWAQDAAAMYEYAANSAEASVLTTFTSAPQVTNPSGAAGQATAVSEAASSASRQFSLTSLISMVPSMLQNLAMPTSAATTGATTTWGTLLSSSGSSGLSSIMNDLPSLLPGYLMVSVTPMYALSSLLGMVQTMQGLAAASASEIALAGEEVAADAAGAAGWGASALGEGVLASAGKAAMLGPLSVPPSWSSVIPTAQLTSAGAVLQNNGIGDAATTPPSLLGGVPRAAAAAGPQAPGPRYGVVPTVMAQPPSAGYGVSVV